MTRRRWRIPPPILYDGDGPGPEGLAILGEFTGELGGTLWKSLRSVILWAESDVANRRNLFPSDLADRRQLEILASVPDDEQMLRGALEDLLPLVARPDTADPQFAGIACHRIAIWAEQRGMHRTQLEYLQAAALCCPANAGFALSVGQASRDLAHYGRAEAWLYRSVGLARQATDWTSYIRAYLAHGHMMFARGVLPSARRSFLKGLRRARRQGLRDGEGRALHYLFNLEFVAGKTAEGMRYAVDALAAYGPGHVRLPALAHDIAYAWMEQGDWQHSLPVFIGVLGRVRAADRPVGLGSVGRCAALAGDTAAYEWAVGELRRYDAVPGVADAWVDLARAALTLGRLAEAEEAARLAESVARARREGMTRFRSEEVMEQIEAERAAIAARASAMVEAGEVSERDSVARDLLRVLQSEQAGAGHTVSI